MLERLNRQMILSTVCWSNRRSAQKTLAVEWLTTGTYLSYREICLRSHQDFCTRRCRWRTERSFGRGQRFLYKVQAVTQFVLIDDERRTNPQHIKAAEGVKVLALQICSKSRHLRTASVERSQRFARRFVSHQLNDAEKPYVANITDAMKPFLHRLKARGEIAALFLNIAKDLFFLVDLQIGNGRGTA